MDATPHRALRNALEMCWFYMGIALLALDPPSALCQMGKRGKQCPKSSWQALTPPGKHGEKKCPKPSWQAFTHTPPPFRAMPTRKQHVLKEASLRVAISGCQQIIDEITDGGSLFK